MKLCLTCQTVKENDDFHWQVKNESRCTQCKKCRAVRRRNRYVKEQANVRKIPDKKTIKLQGDVTLMRWI